MYIGITITATKGDQKYHRCIVIVLEGVFKVGFFFFHLNQQGVGLNHKAHSEGGVEDCRDLSNCKYFVIYACSMLCPCSVEKCIKNKHICKLCVHRVVVSGYKNHICT